MDRGRWEPLDVRVCRLGDAEEREGVILHSESNGWGIIESNWPSTEINDPLETLSLKEK